MSPLADRRRAVAVTALAFSKGAPAVLDLRASLVVSDGIPTVDRLAKAVSFAAVELPTADTLIRLQTTPEAYAICLGPDALRHMAKLTDWDMSTRTLPFVLNVIARAALLLHVAEALPGYMAFLAKRPQLLLCATREVLLANRAHLIGSPATLVRLIVPPDRVIRRGLGEAERRAAYVLAELDRNIASSLPPEVVPC